MTEWMIAMDQQTMEWTRRNTIAMDQQTMEWTRRNTIDYGPTDYGMDKKKYDSYGPTDYYKMDNNDDKKSYEKDNSYESQYSSYKADSKPKYTSYGKDDRDKSQKDSTTIIINNNFKKDVDKGDDIAQCAEDVETCFRQILSDDFAAFENELQEEPITITIETGDSFTFENFEDFCTELAGLEFGQLEQVINALIDQSDALGQVFDEEGERETLIECIAEALKIEGEVYSGGGAVSGDFPPQMNY